VTESLLDYLSFATETAFLAGRLTLGYYQTGVRTDFKADDTPVTVADRGAEELIRSRIETKYPRHAILGEEYGTKRGDDDSHRWLIDPIDGTKSFVRGVPLYSVNIGLEIEGKAKVGVAYFPALDEMIAAASGEGCWWNGRRAHVSNVASLSQAVVTFTNPVGFAENGRTAAWERVKQAAYYCAGWTDTYGYLLVATGRAELALDAMITPWDCAPLVPILTEAGGYFGDWQGNATIHANEGMATTQLLLPQVLALLQDG